MKTRLAIIAFLMGVAITLAVTMPKASATRMKPSDIKTDSYEVVADDGSWRGIRLKVPAVGEQEAVIAVAAQN